MKKFLAIAAVVVGVVLIGGVVYLKTAEAYNVPMLKSVAQGQTVLLDQGWSEVQRTAFHHTAQGTRLVPYEWFMAIEQPCVSLTACEPFADWSYLSRFGFIEGSKDAKLNPDGLPIGFARQADFFDPEHKRSYPVIGLTCAACHTGELAYDKYLVRIEGGPARVDLQRFQKALGLALGFTKLMPLRYGRFERAVLKDGATEDLKKQLRADFEQFLGAAMAEKKLMEDRHIYANQAGFGRTDALTRIGNQAFGMDMKNPDNLTVSRAPVRFPQIWDAPWFNWVQYNSSIANPLVRNIGEAVGVRAVVKLDGEEAGQFANSIDMAGLKSLEDWIAGPAPYGGLRSPHWPKEFPQPTDAEVAMGEELYQKHCQGCHLPPPEKLQEDLKAAEPKYWTKNEYGQPFLRMTDVPVDLVGTDPRQALDFMDRKADSGALKLGKLSAAEGLEAVTRGMAQAFFKKAGLSEKEQREWEGYRDPGGKAVRAEAIYKARPLNGVWAVGPYLHNGSVPNLTEMLVPAAERTKKFWVGTKRFDPKKVGFETTKIEGGYEFDTSLEGNWNTGHEFKDGPREKGTIGPLLKPEERAALVAYLKKM